MAKLVVLAVLGLTVSNASAETPASRAKTIVDAQFAAITKNDDAAMRATFDKTAVLQGLMPDNAIEDSSGYQQAFMNGSPHTAFKKARLGAIVAGGNDKIVWFTAEMAITWRNDVQGERGRGTTTLRLTEVATADAGWKVVAAVMDKPQPKPESRTEYVAAIVGANERGALTELAVSPTKLEAAFTKDARAILIGTAKRERGIGPAAKKLARSWSKLALSLNGTPREVRTKDWGWVAAAVDWTKGKELYRMRVLLVAIPAADGSWTVVTAHYTSG